ncbi:hypothetical protein HYC85_028436 [Camellia sinensis]|uniref:Uncharacterized protein n=1 Tax=Camellia sinensis TaxID=4442 RepID=A0A7J7FV95_CAMSI|nr:hypothetical protein HYC85_028436 [Camellia sinensis]
MVKPKHQLDMCQVGSYLRSRQRSCKVIKLIHQELNEVVMALNTTRPLALGHGETTMTDGK